MKTEDLLAYEREREGVSRVFAQASFELVLPLAVERARKTAPEAETEVSSRKATASGTSGAMDTWASDGVRRLC